jgi:hypothetical protein
MAICRKRALERLNGLVLRVEEHLGKIVASPGNPSVPHWTHEVANWLWQMEELIPHVGVKTGATWKARIKGWRSKIEER